MAEGLCHAGGAPSGVCPLARVRNRRLAGTGTHQPRDEDSRQGERLEQISWGLGGRRKEGPCHSRSYDRQLLEAFKLGG